MILQLHFAIIFQVYIFFSTRGIGREEELMASIGKHLTMLGNDLAVTQNSHVCEQSKSKIRHSRLTCQPIIVCYYRRAVRVRGNARGSRVTHPGTPFLKGAVEENLVKAQLSGKCKRQPMDSQLKPGLQSFIQKHQAANFRWQVRHMAGLLAVKRQCYIQTTGPQIFNTQSVRPHFISSMKRGNE